MHNWYVGQDIVCIKTPPSDIVKKGDVFIIKGLRGPICLCPDLLLDIGLTIDSSWVMCMDCGQGGMDLKGVLWVGERYFAPLNTLVDISEIEELLKEPIYL